MCRARASFFKQSRIILLQFCYDRYLRANIIYRHLIPVTNSNALWSGVLQNGEEPRVIEMLTRVLVLEANYILPGSMDKQNKKPSLDASISSSSFCSSILIFTNRNPITKSSKQMFMHLFLFRLLQYSECLKEFISNSQKLEEKKIS